MMKTTRFIQWSALVLVGAMMASCSSDDEKVVEPEAKNAFTYDGKEYGLKDGYIVDYGNIDPFYNYDDTHYNYDFYISDGEYVKEQEDIWYDAVDAVTEISLYLFYPSSTTFGEAEFAFYDDETILDDIRDKAVFAAEVWFDANGNGVRDEDGDPWIDATGGTVTVTGSDKNYTLFYELQLEDGKTVKGSFSGEFKITEYNY